MRKDIHPESSKMKVIIGKDSINTMSTLGKAEYVVDRDFRKHPAWTKKGITKSDATSSSINNYKKKYGNLDFL